MRWFIVIMIGHVGKKVVTLQIHIRLELRIQVRRILGIMIGDDGTKVVTNQMNIVLESAIQMRCFMGIMIGDVGKNGHSSNKYCIKISNINVTVYLRR